MKCVATYTFRGESYRLYVYIEANKFFVLLPSFEITMYMNNKVIPEKAREIFLRRISDYQNGKIKFS